MHRIDSDGNVSNLFDDGNPPGVEGTLVSDDWLNDVQENIVTVILNAGIPLTKGRASDLFDAINVLVATGSGAEFADLTALQAATSIDAYVVKVANVGGSAEYYFKDVNDVTTADDGLDVIVDGDGVRWKRQIKGWIPYNDGTPIESLKPAEAGADVTGTNIALGAQDFIDALAAAGLGQSVTDFVEQMNRSAEGKDLGATNVNNWNGTLEPSTRATYIRLRINKATGVVNVRHAGVNGHTGTATISMEFEPDGLTVSSVANVSAGEPPTAGVVDFDQDLDVYDTTGFTWKEIGVDGFADEFNVQLSTTVTADHAFRMRFKQLQTSDASADVYIICGDTVVGKNVSAPFEIFLSPIDSSEYDVLLMTNAPAEAGADVTGNNTSNDTDNVDGTPSGQVSAATRVNNPVANGGFEDRVAPSVGYVPLRWFREGQYVTIRTQYYADPYTTTSYGSLYSYGAAAEVQNGGNVGWWSLGKYLHFFEDGGTLDLSVLIKPLSMTLPASVTNNDGVDSWTGEDDAYFQISYYQVDGTLIQTDYSDTAGQQYYDANGGSVALGGTWLPLTFSGTVPANAYVAVVRIVCVDGGDAIQTLGYTGAGDAAVKLDDFVFDYDLGVEALTGETWARDIGATQGATWDVDISGQPADADIFNAQQVWSDISGTGRPADYATNSKVYRQTTAPTIPGTGQDTLYTGDLWIDTDDQNKLYYFNGTNWVETRDEGITQALNDAASALAATSAGSITTFFQDAQPQGNADGDLWFDTDDGNKIYRYSWSSTSYPHLITGDSRYFTSSIGSWTDSSTGAATVSHDAAEDQLELASNGVDTAEARYSVTTVASTTYEIRITKADSNALDIDVGTTAGGNNLINSTETSAGLYKKRFTATGTTTHITFKHQGNYTVEIDEVSMRAVGTWEVAQDDLVAQAIADAATAQATADGKIVTVFLYSAFGPGDLNFLGDTITRSAGSWVDDGFVSGFTQITISNAEDAGNNGTYTIDNVTASTLTSNGASFTTNASDTTATFVNTPVALAVGDLWYAPDLETLARWDGSTWLTVSNNFDSTSQLTDDAGLGNTAIWSGVTGAGKPADYATQTKVFAATTAPTDGVAPNNLNEGDLWIDTDDSNKLYYWDGGAWVLRRDTDIDQALADAATAQSTADGKINMFYQDAAPGSPDLGDFWVETDNGNTLYTYVRYGPDAGGLSFAGDAITRDSGSWLAAGYEIGKSIVVANAEDGGNDGTYVLTNVTATVLTSTGAAFTSNADDTTATIDSWVNAQDSDIGTALTSAATAQATADGKITTFYAVSASPPTAEGVGDLWYQTDTNLMKRWDGANWNATVSNSYDNTNQLTDGALLGETALWDSVTGANKAEDNATYSRIFQQAVAPTISGVRDGDLWIDIDDGNKLYRAARAVTFGPSGTGLAFSGATITRDTGSWLDDGYVAGLSVAVSSAEDVANNGTYAVTAVTDLVLTFGGETFFTNANDTTAVLTPTDAWIEVRDAGAAAGASLEQALIDAGFGQSIADFVDDANAAGETTTFAGENVNDWGTVYAGGGQRGIFFSLTVDKREILNPTVATGPNASLSFSGDTITRITGSWLNTGHELGRDFTVVSAENPANNGTYTITNVTDTVLTAAGAGFTTNTDDDAAVVDGVDDPNPDWKKVSIGLYGRNGHMGTGNVEFELELQGNTISSVSADSWEGSLTSKGSDIVFTGADDGKWGPNGVITSDSQTDAIDDIFTITLTDAPGADTAFRLRIRDLTTTDTSGKTYLTFGDTPIIINPVTPFTVFGTPIDTQDKDVLLMLNGPLEANADVTGNNTALNVINVGGTSAEDIEAGAQTGRDLSDALTAAGLGQNTSDLVSLVNDNSEFWPLATINVNDWEGQYTPPARRCVHLNMWIDKTNSRFYIDVRGQNSHTGTFNVDVEVEFFGLSITGITNIDANTLPSDNLAPIDFDTQNLYGANGFRWADTDTNLNSMGFYVLLDEVPQAEHTVRIKITDLSTNDSSGETLFSLGDSPLAANLDYSVAKLAYASFDDTSNQDVLLMQNAPAAAGANVNAPTIGVKKNFQTFTVANAGEAWIHGFGDDGLPANVDAYFYFDGALVFLDDEGSQSLRTSQVGEGYIYFDTSKADRFTMDAPVSNRSIVYAKKEGGVWYYDDNAAWQTFTPQDQDIVIGSVVTAADNILNAVAWGYGVSPGQIYEAGADVTADNTALDTANVNGTPAATIDAGAAAGNTIESEATSSGQTLADVVLNAQVGASNLSFATVDIQDWYNNPYSPAGNNSMFRVRIDRAGAQMEVKLAGFNSHTGTATIDVEVEVIGNTLTGYTNSTAETALTDNMGNIDFTTPNRWGPNGFRWTETALALDDDTFTVNFNSTPNQSTQIRIKLRVFSDDTESIEFAVADSFLTLDPTVPLEVTLNVNDTTDINALNTLNGPAEAGADVTGSNTSLDTTNVAGTPSTDISQGSGDQFSHDFESGEIVLWDAGDYSIIAELGTVYSGTQAALVETGGADPVGAALPTLDIPDAISAHFLDEKLKVSFLLQQHSVPAKRGAGDVVVRLKDNSTTYATITATPTAAWEKKFTTCLIGTSIDTKLFLEVDPDDAAVLGTDTGAIIDRIAVETVVKDSDIDGTQVTNVGTLIQSTEVSINEVNTPKTVFTGGADNDSWMTVSTVTHDATGSDIIEVSAYSDMAIDGISDRSDYLNMVADGNSSGWTLGDAFWTQSGGAVVRAESIGTGGAAASYTFTTISGAYYWMSVRTTAADADGTLTIAVAGGTVVPGTGTYRNSFGTTGTFTGSQLINDTYDWEVNCLVRATSTSVTWSFTPGNASGDYRYSGSIEDVTAWRSAPGMNGAALAPAAAGPGGPKLRYRVRRDAAVEVSGVNLEFTTSTIIRASGSWVDDGYADGGTITITEAEDAGNNGTFTISGTPSATTLTVSGAPFTANALDTSAIVRSGGGVVLFTSELIPVSGVGQAPFIQFDTVDETPDIGNNTYSIQLWWEKPTYNSGTVSTYDLNRDEESYIQGSGTNWLANISPGWEITSGATATGKVAAIIGETLILWSHEESTTRNGTSATITFTGVDAALELRTLRTYMKAREYRN